jgi:uncharacterized protein (DUF362 family)/NAD-dependent dihydropyrimidine dehydrogenase PreA subunit
MSASWEITCIMADVSLIRCDTYDRDVVEKAVRDAVGLLGGMSSFVRPGERVLVKPNLLHAAAPDRAITTHPSIVASVIKLVKEAGATPIVGDSPGIPLYDRVLRITGIAAVARELGAEAPDFSVNPVDAENPSGLRVKRLVVARPAIEADTIISVSKLKTHGQVYFTGAIKNQFGCVPGLLKAQYHMRFPDRELFAGALLDINRYLKPKLALAIMDGVVGMEGNGPSGGRPRKLGVIIAGRDFPAVDAVACRVVNIDPMTVPTTRLAYETGFATEDIGAIRVLGERVEDVVVQDFERLRVVSNIGQVGPLPSFIAARIRDSLVPKPAPDRDLCTRCGVCVETCPAVPKALSLTDRGIVIDYAKCIRCYCCQEMCPAGAMKLRSGLLAKLINR